MRHLLAALSILFSALLLGGLATAVNAQEGSNQVPPPYAGLKNPFPWSDPAAQQEGKKLYQRSCQSCHGANGGNLATANFSAANFARQLEEKPDFYFWVSNEGRLNKGMPPFKSTLSSEQQWQILTYLWSLSKPSPVKETPAPPEDAPAIEGTALSLTAPQFAQAGQVLTLLALLEDAGGQPVENATVTFSVKQEFFISGLMEIGRRQTDDRGSASLRYTPKEAGQIEVVARYKTVEAKLLLNVVDSKELSYETNAGINLPAPGAEVFLGPGAHGLGEMDAAPTFALRLPGGTLSWLLILAAAVVLIWATYFRVVYQVFRIPLRQEITDTDTRRVPLIGLAMIIAIGVFLVLKVITGPYSHFHLLP